MNAHGSRGLAVLLLLGGGLQAQSQLNEYALILRDPPAARRISVLDYGARLRTAQQQVLDELVRREIAVTGSAHVLVNAVFVRAARDRVAELRAIPGVARVEYLPPVHRKLNQALGLVNVSAAWSALGGGQNAGKGIKIGILDTGIDQNHPAFQDNTVTPPAGFPKGEQSYTNSKVIVARSYVAMLPFATVDPRDSRPDDVTPRDRSGHGTAMAMIAAGEQVSGPLATISGIAPKAFLGNYKIFGSPGVNDTTTAPVIIQALEDAISDKMDIVVLPVGDPAGYGALEEDPSCAGAAQPLGIPSDACDVRAEAVENAVRLGLTVVVPGGNDGDTAVNYPALASIDTPGTAPAAITVGATTNAHILYWSVTMRGAAPANALFGDGVKLMAPLSAPVRDVSQFENDGFACTALPANSLSGAVALVQRGNCTFAAKVLNAENAGARAVVIAQSAGNPLPFTPTGLTTTGIPAVMVGASDGTALQNFARSQPKQNVTLDPAAHTAAVTADAVAAYSSRGPAIWTGAIKPDLVAPGSDLYTAAQSYDPNGDVYSASGFTAVEGTSFAAGLVAGAAALVKQAHPGFTPGQIKSALVNRARPNVVLDGGAMASITAAGAGKLDAGAALGTPLTIEPATVSFGEIGASTSQLSVPLTLTNVTGAPMNVSLQVQPSVVDSFASVVLSSSSLTIAPGHTQVTAQLQGSQPLPGAYEGFIVINGGGATLRVPYLYLASDGIAANVLPLAGGSFTGSVNDQGFVLAFKVIDQFGVAIAGDPVQFGVAAGDGVFTATDPGTDVLGIAAAQVNLGSQPGDQIFAAAVNGFQVEFDGSARLRPAINSGGVVNAGSHQTGKGLAPGSYAEIYGAGLSDVMAVAATPYLPVALAGVSVSFDAPGLSLPGHIYFVTPGQVDVQIPWEFEGLNSVSMKVSVGGSQSAVYTLPLASASPAAFQKPDSTGNRTVAAARDKNNNVISSANPAHRGDTITMYVNGLGAVSKTPPSGDPTSSQSLSKTVATVQVNIGGVNAPVAFSGLSPGSIGLYQINLTVPAQAPAGLQPVVISVDGISSNAANLPLQ